MTASSISAPCADASVRPVQSPISSAAPSASAGTKHGGPGTPAITMMVVAAAAPLTVLSGGPPLGILNGNGAAFPVSFVVVGVALLLFSIGFAAMGRHVTGSGGFFDAIGRGIHPVLGLVASTLALFTYAMIQSAIYCFLGMQIATCMASMTGLSLPWWVCSLVAAGVVGVLGYRNIAMSAKVVNVLIAGEIAVAVVLCVAIFARYLPLGIDFAATFSPSVSLEGAPGVAIIFAIASFVGFESTSIYRAEAKNPDVTVPRATYVAVVFVTLLYLVSSFAIVVAWCSDGDVDAVALAAGDMLQMTGAKYVGGWFANVISALIITSLFAAVVSFHNVLARYLRSMVDTHALPAALGRLHARHHSPTVASLVVSAMSTVILACVGVAGLDSFTQAFSWFSGAAVLGFVLLLVLACLAVVVMFVRHADLRAREGVLKSVVAPAAGVLLLVAILVCAVVYFPGLVGEATFGVTCGTLVVCTCVSLVVGVVEALVMRARRHDAYRVLEAAVVG